MATEVVQKNFEAVSVEIWRRQRAREVKWRGGLANAVHVFHFQMNVRHAVRVGRREVTLERRARVQILCDRWVGPQAGFTVRFTRLAVRRSGRHEAVSRHGGRRHSVESVLFPVRSASRSPGIGREPSYGWSMEVLLAPMRFVPYVGAQHLEL